MSEQKEVDYSNTVNLPQTDFPQRASLAQREPERLAKWEQEGLYAQQAGRTDRPNYVLHDGPPYANGDIHIGHTLNKVLKDIITRYKAMQGFRSHYVPGWDCHGLPIEQKVVEDLRKKKEYAGKSALEIRKLCQAYANKWVDTQREQFKRLGVWGDWEHPYITMDPKFEVAILEGFLTLAERGYVYKGLKVVHWDPVFETALAEAEINHKIHVSPSIYVKFPLLSDVPVDELRGVASSIVIWTTTPWTLPANLGVSVHPNFLYVAYRVNGDVLIVAQDLLRKFQEETGLAGGEVIAEFRGTVLDRLRASHPLLPKESLVMLGHHVTLEQGTGAVHTAPGHGVEDFMIGQEYGLDVFNPVDEKGRFTAAYPDMEGTNVFDANPMVIDKLKEKGLLLGHKPYEHSYPYSWRSHKPVIMRATEQWFMAVDKDGLRDKALAEIDKVTWTPSWGYDRIRNMVKGRPDWCLSRQRSWGVPIPSILDKQTGKSLLDSEVIANLIKVVATEGTDCWFARPLTDFLPDRMKAEADRYEKEYNCLDVWFDSGATHLAVLNQNYGLTWPADLYLEGGDQHRGWFQSSLWVAMGTKDAAPYRQVLTHGFVLDDKKRPMSKSLGNVISPLDVIRDYGADVIRLWVSSEDYRDDVSISKTALEQVSTAYRRIRNTVRYILSNLYDFDPAKDALELSQLGEDDRLALHQLNGLIASVTDAYEKFEFHRVYQLVNGFCVTELGAAYLDQIKDRLYCGGVSSRERRASQTALHALGTALCGLMAPILAFTADEAWELLPGRATASVHLADFPKVDSRWTDEALSAKWQKLFLLRGETSRRIEPLRAKERKVIGNSLDAKVTLRSRDAETLALLRANLAALPSFLIVSQVEVLEEDAGEIASELQAGGLQVSVEVTKAPGHKCPRCWRTTMDSGLGSTFTELCARCADVMRRKTEGEESNVS